MKKNILIPIFFFSAFFLISCNTYQPKLQVKFPNMLLTSNNINFETLTTKNMKNINFNLKKSSELLVNQFIEGENNSLDKALKLVVSSFTFSGILLVNHGTHYHEVSINNILLSNTYGNFFLKIQPFIDGKIFKKEKDKIIFNFKIASSNNLFSYVYKANNS